MKKAEKKEQIKKYQIWCLYICILLIIVSANYTNSRYVSVADGDVDLEVAKAIVEITNLAAIIQPIETNNVQKEISFEVKNKNIEDEINDVNFLYKLKIETTNEMPIEYTLYKVNNSIRTVVNVTNGISEEFSLQHTTEQIDLFVLVFKINDKDYQDQTDNISISVTARQVID